MLPSLMNSPGRRNGRLRRASLGAGGVFAEHRRKTVGSGTEPPPCASFSIRSCSHPRRTRTHTGRNPGPPRTERVRPLLLKRALARNGALSARRTKPRAPSAPVVAASPGAESSVSGKTPVMGISFPGTSVIHFSLRDDVKSRVFFPVWTGSRD